MSIFAAQYTGWTLRMIALRGNNTLTGQKDEFFLIKWKV